MLKLQSSCISKSSDHYQVVYQSSILPDSILQVVYYSIYYRVIFQKLKTNRIHFTVEQLFLYEIGHVAISSVNLNVQ